MPAALSVPLESMRSPHQRRALTTAPSAHGQPRRGRPYYRAAYYDQLVTAQIVKACYGLT